MQLAPQPASTASAAGSDLPLATPARRPRMLVAGIAVASAGVLAVTPVTVAPSASELEKASVELAAFTNPITTFQNTFANTFASLNTLNTSASASAAALSEALADPAVQAQFTGVFANVTNPQRIRATLAALPGYGDRLGAASEGFAVQVQEALEALPGVLQVSAGFLAEGKFLEAYAEVNLWFLTVGLSDFRGSLLDAARVPGDFLDSIGLEPLARILGTTWMDKAVDAQGRPGYGPGLLSRAIIGNFGRAVLGAPVTAIFQTAEIMDAVGVAIQSGDVETAVSELVNAPIKITNAFLNGYVPAFVTDPESPIPPGPGQNFPGLIGPTGTFDFLLRQVPAEIAKSLLVVRPPVQPQIAATVTPPDAQASDAPSSIPADERSLLLKLDTTTPTATSTPPVDASTPPVDAALTPSGTTDPETAVTTGVSGDSLAPVGEPTAPVAAASAQSSESESGTSDDTTAATKSTTSTKSGAKHRKSTPSLSEKLNKIGDRISASLNKAGNRSAGAKPGGAGTNTNTNTSAGANSGATAGDGQTGGDDSGDGE